jgi:hypothetical protein
MSDVNPAYRRHVSYIDKSRDFYFNKGFDNPYRWATFDEVPFAPLTKPLSASRLGLITTAGLQRSKEKFAAVYAEPMSPRPDWLQTGHVSWHKSATHTDDIDSFFPINRLNESVQSGKIAELAPRFYGLPTSFSQRKTAETFAPALLDLCRQDQVDVVLLAPL